MDKETVFEELVFQTARIARGEQFDAPQNIIMEIVRAPWYPGDLGDDTLAEISLTLNDMGVDGED